VLGWGNTGTLTRQWFNPILIDENESANPNHGEFRSPAWIAVLLAIMANHQQDDEFADALASPVIPGTAVN
jgi:hypothetical protein